MRYHDIIGLDLGVAHSTAAIWDHEQGAPVIVPTRSGAYSLPSVITVNSEGRIVVGNERNWSRAEIVLGADFLVPQRGCDASTGRLGTRIKVGIQELSTTELASLVLAELRVMGESFTGGQIQGAVVSVPRWFTSRQRSAIVNACSIAGLNVHRLVNQTTAAAVDICSNVAEDGRQHFYIIYGLGEGGGESCTLATHSGHIRVLGGAVDPDRGGRSWTDRLWAWVMKEIERCFSVNLSLDPEAFQFLRYEAAHARIALSTDPEAAIRLPISDCWPTSVGRDSPAEQLSRDKVQRVPEERAPSMVLSAISMGAESESGPSDANRRRYLYPPIAMLTVKRSTLPELTSDLLAASLTCIDSMVESTCKVRDLEKEQFEEIFVFGEATRAPWIRPTVAQHLGFPLGSVRRPLDMDHAVARGAAIVASRMVGAGYRGTPSGQVHYPRQPARAVEDLSPAAVGIPVGDRTFHTIIPKGALLPIRVAVDGFTNATDNDTAIRIDVMESLDEVVGDGELIGSIQIQCEPRPRGYHRLEVTFGLDSSQLFQVSVRDLMGSGAPVVRVENWMIDQALATQLSERLRSLLSTPHPIISPPMIFVSYRRKHFAYAGRVADALRHTVDVFMDVDSINPGADFQKRIESAIKASFAIVAIIDKEWMPADTVWGRQRRKTIDVLQVEISTALKQGKFIVPVLVGGATMPSEDDLPDEIRDVARRQALRLEDQTWDQGIASLVELLTRENSLSQSGRC